MSPAYGWRSFWTEITIVVLGILIALGAQQAVDGWKSRRSLDEFRAALDGELEDSLSGYRARVAQSGCVIRKLAQLEAWQREWRDGRGSPLAGTIGRPLAFGVYTSVWETGAAGAVGDIPLEQRLAYARLYASFGGYNRLREQEIEIWRDLYAFDGARSLSPPEVNMLRGLLLSARSINESIRNNWTGIRRVAMFLGLRVPVEPATPNRNGLCDPLRIGD